MSTLKFNKWQSIDGVTRNAVLQVVSDTISTQATTTSATWTDSPITLSITPTSATSKILVMVTVYCRAFKASSNYSGLGLRINRGSTTIFNPNYTDASGNRTYIVQKSSSTQSNDFLPLHLSCIDSPASNEELTYTVQFNSFVSSSVSINLTGSGYPDCESTITLMEIAQ